MPNQYKIIDGVKYDRELLEHAQMKTKISKKTAGELWEKALRDHKVTETERQTLKFILVNFEVDAAAREFLEQKLGSPLADGIMKGHNYYKRIDGIVYCRKLLEDAEALEKPITAHAAMELWGSAHDGTGVTSCQKRTLEYIFTTYKLEDEAYRAIRKVMEVKRIDVEPTPLLISDAADVIADLDEELLPPPSWPAEATTVSKQPSMLKSFWHWVSGTRPEGDTGLAASEDKAGSSNGVPAAQSANKRKETEGSEKPSGKRFRATSATTAGEAW